MQITFYTFSKKQNSTKVPSSSATSVTYDCIIKEDCSVLAPVIRLDIGITTSLPVAWNYAYISDWGRYYFVNDWTFGTRLWTASLTVDVLASFKTDILALTPYVVRSASAFNSAIVDNSYPAMATETAERSGAPTTITLTSAEVSGTRSVSSAWTSYLDQGYFYVTVMSGSGNGYSMWVFNWEGYKAFIKSVYNLTISISGISNDLAKVLVNPIKYVTKVMWCPFLFPDVTLGTNTVWVGYNYGVTATNCASVSGYTFFAYTVDIEIPKHPASSRGKWTNCSPYTKYTLYAKPFGTFTLNAIDMVDDTDLTVDVRIDLRTGEGYLRAYCDSTDRVYLVDTIAQFMVDIPVVQTSITQVGLLGMGLSGLSELINTSSTSTTGIMGNFNAVSPYTGEVKSILNQEQIAGVQNTLSSIGSALSTYGNGMSSSGGYTNITLFYGFQPAIEAVFLNITADDNEHQGRPLMAEVTLSTLSGFTLCRDGEIDIACTDTEKRTISSYMTSGFFIE